MERETVFGKLIPTLRTGLVRNLSGLGLLAAALFALPGAKLQGLPTQEQPCIVLVRSGGSPLSEFEKQMVAAKPIVDLEKLKSNERYSIRTLDPQTYIVIDLEVPILRRLRATGQMVRAFAESGKSRRFSELAPKDRQQVANVLSEMGFTHEPVSDNSPIALAVEDSFEFDFGGKSIRLHAPLKGGMASFADVRAMVAIPLEERASKGGPNPGKTGIGPEEESVQILCPLSVRNYVKRADLAAQAAKALHELSVEEAVNKDLACKELFQRLLSQNSEIMSDLPRKGMSLEDLKPSLRDQLKESFLGGHKAYGFHSREEAELAWSGGRLSNAGLSMGLQFAYKRQDGTISPTVIVFGSSRFGW